VAPRSPSPDEGNQRDSLDPPQAPASSSMKILRRLFATVSLIGSFFAPALLAQVGEGAPGWIKPGMRLTFYGASSGGGQAFTQVDVAYLDQKVAALCMRTYLVDAGDGAIHAPPAWSGLVTAGPQRRGLVDSSGRSAAAHRG